MRSSVKGFLAAILGLVCALAQAQFPGFERPLNGDAGIGLAAGDQRSAAISEGNGVQLVVWADERANPYPYYEYETSSDIYAMRIDANGVTLDAVPFAIASGPGSQTAPQAAWNGSHWLVVFNTTMLSGTGFYYQGGLAGVRVAADGTLVDTEPFRIPGLGSGSWALASDGSQWVIVAQGNDVTNDIVAVRVSATGKLLDPPTRTLVEETYYGRSGIRLAHAAGVFLLTYSDGSNGTRAVRFDTSLDLLDSTPVNLLSPSLSDLASNGTEFFIAWNQQLPDYSLATMASRVSTGAALLDSPGIQVSGAFPPDASGGAIGVAWDGSNWRVSWPNGGNARVATISPSGALSAPGGSAVAGVTPGVSAGTGAGGVQFAWSDFTDNEYDVFAAAIDINDAVLFSGGVSTAAPMQYRTEVAAGASGYMVVYRSRLAGRVRLLAQPLDGQGLSLTAEPTELASGTNLSGPGSPAVAWNGSHFLVAWSSPTGVMAARLTEAGALVDGGPITVADSAFGPVQVAAAGNDFLVVGLQFGTTVHYVLPVGVRVSGAGAVLDGQPLVLGGFYARSPEVTELGGRWLVAWHRSVTHDDPMTETLGVFVEPGGSVGSAFPIHGYFSISGGNSIFTVGLASGGGKALMVQSQELTSGVETDLLAHVVEPGGSVGPAINLTPWPGNQYRPDVSYDGTDFIVVFHDQKNRVAPHALSQLDARGDIYGMRVSPAGEVVDSAGFLVADSPLGETDVAIASRGPDTLVLASQVRNDDLHAAYRIQAGAVLDGTDRMPIAVAAADVTSGDVPLQVNFRSTGSRDPEGSPVSYLWQFGDGTTSVQADPSHLYSTPGEYPAILTVFDGLGQPASQGVTVVATAPNLPPVAVASASVLSGPVPFRTTVFARGSYDPDGALGNTEWTTSNGQRSYNPTAYFTFNTAGTYDITLRVYDSRGAFSEDTLSVVATNDNQPPTASIVANPSAGPAPLTVTLNGSGSSDPDGSIVAYAWDFGDGTTGSGASPTHLYTGQGTYTARLTVTDNSGATATDSATIVVDGIAAQALLTAIDMGTTKQRGVTSVFANVTVTNGDGGAERSAIVNGVWTLPDGTRVSRYEYSDRKGVAGFKTPAASDGDYVLEIYSVTKSGFRWAEGDSETIASYTLGGGNGNQEPIAAFTVSCTRLACTFDAGGSSDPDGAIVAYDWNFGDGAGGSGVTTSHAYASAGTYSVTLTVTDDQSATGQASQTLTVTGDPSPQIEAHVADLDGKAVSAPRNRWNATVTVRVHDEGHAPVSGATVSGGWSNGANGSGSCVTDGAGVCQVSKSNLKGNVGSVTFSVANVGLTGGSYVPSANHDPDGDSNGSVIVIQR